MLAWTSFEFELKTWISCFLYRVQFISGHKRYWRKSNKKKERKNRSKLCYNNVYKEYWRNYWCSSWYIIIIINSLLISSRGLLESKDWKESRAYLLIGLEISFYHKTKQKTSPVMWIRDPKWEWNFTHRWLGKFLIKGRSQGGEVKRSSEELTIIVTIW